MHVLVLRKRAISNLMLVGVASGALALAGCGGDDGEESSTASLAPPQQGGDPGPAPNPDPTPDPSPAPSNRAPTIAGSPPATVMHGNTYSFTPNASDPDGDTLTFSVENPPGWANFDSSTGRLSGTPSAADIGTYGNIRITVSDGKATASLAAFGIEVVGTATGSATLTWTPPTQNTDGSELRDLAGYKIYWGTSRGNYTKSVTVNNPGLASYVVDELTPATWYFAVTAINSMGVESAYSNEASKQVL